MKYQENYTYPAILDNNDEGFVNIIFPSFGNAVTCVPEGEDPIAAAQDWLALEIKSCEDEGMLPPDNNGVIPEIQHGQKLVYVNLWMPYHRSAIKETYVKKTLTIPAWIDMLAKQSNLNFSAILTAALQDKLGLTREIPDSRKREIYSRREKLLGEEDT